ncbi:MAG: hypothetical protein A2081_00305 [Elusimicrobia bacterium GWC2_61_19]|nr:MAG: hypothetical protein A2081_00305 [Elusimicrobia bacterium GWC2_61_19]
MAIKILIADDDEQITEALSRLLKDYKVLVARDGKSALDSAVSWKPDLILLDIAMPVMNGIEVLEKLTAMPRKPLVIMLTGDESVKTVSKAMAIGVFSYITKPFDAELVLDQVRKVAEFLGKSSAV